MVRSAILTMVGAMLCPPILAAQSDDRAAVLAVTDSALAAISRNDFVALSDLMIDEAVVAATGERDGVAFARADGRAAWRARTSESRWTERGWKPTVLLQAGLAVVWLPYDFYRDGEWSHCGIDTFTLVKQGERWMIAALAFTMEQPPACEPHPDGPLKGTP